MKYSIIIPTLNEEKLLPQLLKQFFETDILEKYDAEIIISDGGSKDGTIEISKKYNLKCVVYKGDERQTISMGRNSGAQVASGNILIFLDGDILFEDINKFFAKVDKLFATEKYLAMTCYIKIHPDEEILSDKLFLSFYNWYFRLLNNVGVGMGRGECQIVRKDIFEKLNGYDESLVAGEDFDLFKRIRRRGKIFVDKNLTIFESPRRYREYGHSKIFFTWLVNAISVIVLKKSFTKEWKDIR